MFPANLHKKRGFLIATVMIYHESNLAGSDPLRFRVQRYSDRASIFRGAVAANRKGMGKYQYFKGNEFVGSFLLTRLDDTRWLDN